MNIIKLDSDTSWIAQAGPALNISPVAPVSYSITPIPSKRASWLLETDGTMDPAGKLYPGVLFAPGANGVAVPLPILQNTGKVSLLFDLWVDERTLLAANSIESDLLIVQNGLKFNLSGQRLITGAIEIGNWTDTGLRAAPLVPNSKLPIAWDYSFDLTAKTCSVLAYDGAAIGTRFGNMPATPSNWETGAYLQFQLGSLPAGDPWAIRIEDVRLEWA